MTVGGYIQHLLYRHDCVIIPSFGGLIANQVSAKINSTTNTFSPPCREIIFNINLQKNDGLLIKHISDGEKISYQKAVSKVAAFVEDLKSKLKDKKKVKIEKIGTFYQSQENKLVFIPNKKESFFSSSFGMEDFKMPLIHRKSITEELFNDKKGRSIDQVLRYAATLLLLIFSSVVLFNVDNIKGKVTELGFNFFTSSPSSFSKEKQIEKTIIIEAEEAKSDKELEKKGSLESEKIVTLNIYHIIVGSFSEKENAEKLVSFIINTNDSASLIEAENGFFRVSLETYSDKALAVESLALTQKKIETGAWILTKTIEG